jgi:Protein of unknown function (DUF3040)
MFSEAEQRRLAEIETSLRFDDPAFVRRFDARWHTPRKVRILALVAFVLAVTGTVVALIVASVPAAVVGLCGMGAAAGVWLTHRRRDRDGRRHRRR